MCKPDGDSSVALPIRPSQRSTCFRLGIESSPICNISSFSCKLQKLINPPAFRRGHSPGVYFPNFCFFYMGEGSYLVLPKKTNTENNLVAFKPFKCFFKAPFSNEFHLNARPPLLELCLRPLWFLYLFSQGGRFPPAPRYLSIRAWGRELGLLHIMSVLQKQLTRSWLRCHSFSNLLVTMTGNDREEPWPRPRRKLNGLKLGQTCLWHKPQKKKKKKTRRQQHFALGLQNET